MHASWAWGRLGRPTTLLPPLPARVPQISMYINSPGGVVTAGLAIYDTMQYIRCPVSTLAIGQAASMASLLLAGGEKGHRRSLPHSRVMLHQPSGGAQVRARARPAPPCALRPWPAPSSPFSWAGARHSCPAWVGCNERRAGSGRVQRGYCVRVGRAFATSTGHYAVCCLHPKR